MNDTLMCPQRTSFSGDRSYPCHRCQGLSIGLLTMKSRKDRLRSIGRFMELS